MSGIKGLLSSKVGITISPALATLAGAAVGCIFTILSAMMPPRDFSVRELASLAFFLVPVCGIFGYILWLCGDRSRSELFARVSSCFALVMVVGLIVAFPSAWLYAVRTRGSLVVMLISAVFATALVAVGAAWGIAHLVGYLASTFRRSSKPGALLRTDGWDSELV